MKRKMPNGNIYHSLGDLRIMAPIEELEPFIEWLNNQNCHIVGFDEIQAKRGYKAIDMSINIFGTDETN